MISWRIGVDPPIWKRRASLAAGAPAVAAISASAGLGWLVWVAGVNELSALAALPVVWACSTWRVALVAAFAYYLCGVWPVQPAVITFFPSWPAWVAAAIWVTFALLLAAPWAAVAAIASKGRPRLAAGFAAVVVAASLLPPMGVISWCNPVLALGWLAPGSAIAGVFVLALAWCAAIAAVARYPDKARAILLGCAAGLIALRLLGPGVTLTEEQRALSQRVVAVSSQMRVPATMEEVSLQIERIRFWIQQSQLPDGTVIAWPETMLANWNPATQYIVEERLLRLAKRWPVLIGTTWVDPVGDRYNGAVLLDSKGLRLLRARQPLPIGMWRPWDTAGHHAAAWGEDLRLDIDGVAVALRVCAEEFTLFWALWDQVRSPGPAVQLGIGNTWWATTPIQERSHRLHAEALARIVGQPLQRAINHGVALEPAPGVSPLFRPMQQASGQQALPHPTSAPMEAEVPLQGGDR